MMASLDDSEPYQLKRKIIPGHIDVHPTDNAIIVNYSVQAHIVEDGGAGQPIAGDRKAAQKIIRIKTLGPHSNLTALAQEVVDKCKLIHPTKTKEVEQVLYYLLQRQGGGQGGAGAGDDVMSDREWLRRQLDDQKREEEHATADVFKAEAPSINDIESYIEGLYEEIPEKIKSTRSVLELARGPQNLDALVGNEALISALARVLREDNRKSTALNTNIVTIFYSFSQFQQFQAIITTHKVGDMCLRIVEMELKRFAIWVEDLKAFQLKATQNPTDKAAVAELDQETRKFQAMLQKQDQLLFVSFHLLLNLANDLTIEPKMVKRGIVRYLVEMLDRGTPELVVLGVTFLKRLCIVGENKDEIVAMGDGFLSKLSQLIPSEHETLQPLLLRLLLTLVHDSHFRTLLHRTHLPAKLVSHLSLTTSANSTALKRQTTPTLQILYMLSLDDRGRAAFAGTDVASLVLRMLLSPTSSSSSGSGGGGTAERAAMMALAVNLAHHPKTAPTLMMMEGEEVGASSSLKFLMRKVAKSRDPLMWKMMRGMAGCTGLDGRMAFLDYIDDIMHHLMKPGSSSSTLVEILGLLATLTIPDFDYAKLCAAYTLLPFLQSRLHSAVQIVAAALPNHPDGSDQGAAGAGLAEDDDVTLEVVALLGTMSADEGVAPMIAETQIVQTLMELMIAKEDDDEMILQIIYCGYQLLLHESTRAVLLDETEIVSYLIDLLYDRNVEIRRMCDVCLDLISETDEEYLTKIQHQKFHYHNSEWLHRIAQSSSTHDLNLSPDPYSLHHQHASHAAALRRDVDSDMYASYVRRGAIFDAKDEWSESGSDGEDGEEDFGKGMVVGGNNALLDGFD